MATAVLVTAGAIGLGAVGAMADSEAGPRRPNQTQLILRLNDLPPGYLNVALQEEQEDRIICRRLHGRGDGPLRLRRFADQFRPKGCVAAYSRLFDVDDQQANPIVAATGVLDMKSREAADAAWNLLPYLLAQLLEGHRPKEVRAPARVGSATRLFHTADPPRIYPLFYTWLGHTASFLVWRWGNTLAVVMTTDESFADGDRAALTLARRQQAHIRKPTPYTRAERFDGEVPLEDPALEIPVYWLGRNFRPSGGLPQNRLFDSYATAGRFDQESKLWFDVEMPGSMLVMRYGTIRLNTWTQTTWREYRDTRAAHAIVAWYCTRKRRVELPSGGHAVIYGGYEKNYRRCPRQPPNAFTGRAFFGDLIVAVNPISVGPYSFIETVNPYGSFAGMEAIVRSLKLRPSPAY
jgi:hypothetical protein